MMRYLIDTHTLIWWWDSSPKLPERIAAILSQRSNDIFVSAVSGLEMGIKVRLKKLPAMESRIGEFEIAVAADGFHNLPCSTAHALLAGTMAGNHRDPFDRMLAAQALIENMNLVTRDREIAEFGCQVLW